MKVMRGPVSLVLLGLVMLQSPACGGGDMNRQLQSITVSPATADAKDSPGGQVSFTATGNYNASPMTVTPLAVSWLMMGPGIDPPGPTYQLITQPFQGKCLFQGPGTFTITAIAPADPNAAASGTMPQSVFLDLVVKHVQNEAGFVSATAQLTCP